MKRILFFFGVLATVAVGHSFANKANTNKLTPISGSPLSGSSTPCNQVVGCDTEGTILCTVTYEGVPNTQLYGQDDFGTCTIPLNKLP